MADEPGNSAEIMENFDFWPLTKKGKKKKKKAPSDATSF